MPAGVSINYIPEPVLAGIDGQVLTVQADGTYAWEDAASGSPGGVTGQLQYNNDGAFDGAGITWDGSVTVQPSAANKIGLIAKGAAGQTANLQEWQDSDGNAKLRINTVGQIVNIQSSTTARCDARNLILHDQSPDGSVYLSSAGPNTAIYVRASGGFVSCMIGSAEGLRLDANAATGETRTLVWDVNTGSLKRVKVGADGSGPGGVGRALYIDNTT